MASSAGILLYRRAGGRTLEVLLAHMGGPYWARKDEGAWSIPKGEYSPGEPAFDAARREFAEELGVPAPEVEYLDLGTVRQSGGKSVSAWAGEWDLDPDAVAAAVGGVFEMEWPPRSGRRQSFPEIDRVAWFPLDLARQKVVKGQRALLERLAQLLEEPAG